MPSARYDAAACVIGSTIFVVGGADEDNAQDSLFKYDTEADEWSTLAPMPHACCGHSTSVFGNLVYIVGIMSHGSDFFSVDPVSGAWSTLAPTLHNRFCGTSFVLAGCLYAAGGFQPSSVSSVERYDVVSGTWTAVADLIECRSNFCAVTIGSSSPAEEQDLFDSLIAKASTEATTGVAEPVGKAMQPKGTKCCLCWKIGGIMKPVVESGPDFNGNFAHCVNWLPHASFKDAVSQTPVTNLDKVDKRRFRLVCAVCNEKKGACIQCKGSAHVSCTLNPRGHNAGFKLLTKGDKKCFFCPEHSGNQ
jgi:hypothetical protein